MEGCDHMKPFNKKWLQRISSEPASPKGIARRTFLVRGGVALGSGALLGLLPLSCMRQATEEEKKNFPKPGVKTEYRRTICTHCSVGCGVIAEVQNGVWVGQEPDYDSPLNLGAHCAKGASVRDHGFGDKRVKYPMKLVNGDLDTTFLGSGHQRDRRPALEDQGGIGAGRAFLLRFVQGQQRRGLSPGEIRRPLGHEQRGQPGAHLPFHHRGRGGEHLGLRRHDQFLQRHAQQQGHALPRQQRRRGPPGGHAAYPARQGERAPK